MERDHLQDLGVERKIILKWIFKTWEAEAWTVNCIRNGTGDRRL